jgi:hypothetical protein
VLASYVANVKKYDYNTAYYTIARWLDKCAGKRPLKFNVNYKIRYALNRANKKDGPVSYPMRLDTMKSKYPEMYKEVFITARFLWTDESGFCVCGHHITDHGTS